MEFKLLIFLSFISFVNFILLIFIGLFLVRFRDRVDNVFTDLIEAMEVMWEAVPLSANSEPKEQKEKTWDQKYEAELESITRRLQSDSVLKDLPDPVLSWGEPPAINNQNIEGLSIKNIAKSPMNAKRVDRA